MQLRSIIGRCSALIFSVFLFSNAQAQDVPTGALVNGISCKLNHGVTIQEAVAWARAQDRSGPQPGAEFYRQAVVNGNFLDEYDFRIVTYYQSFSHIVEVALANPPAGPNHLFTCDNSTQSTVANRQVNENSDAFTGDATVMHTRFCILEEGETLEDAWDFVVAVNENFTDAGDNAIMQLSNRVVGPIPGANMDNVGRGVVITAVPSTPQGWAERMDMSRNGFQPLRGVSTPFESCNYPAVWVTHAVWRAPAQ